MAARAIYGAEDILVEEDNLLGDFSQRIVSFLRSDPKAFSFNHIRIFSPRQMITGSGKEMHGA